MSTTTTRNAFGPALVGPVVMAYLDAARPGIADFARRNYAKHGRGAVILQWDNLKAWSEDPGTIVLADYATGQYDSSEPFGFAVENYDPNNELVFRVLERQPERAHGDLPAKAHWLDGPNVCGRFLFNRPN